MQVRTQSPEDPRPGEKSGRARARSVVHPDQDVPLLKSGIGSVDEPTVEADGEVRGALVDCLRTGVELDLNGAAAAKGCCRPSAGACARYVDHALARDQKVDVQ